METGLSSAAKRKYVTIIDRKEAILSAVDLAKAEDIVLVAGKGHEKYQDINGVKFPFDDKLILEEAFKKLNLKNK
jgi:UDP-N-acetylmuramoyl-L-alanyl-D-glutamate--2,6-diaminopimelate ligase